MKLITIPTLILSVSLTMIGSVEAQQYIFPENGQTKEQQQQDEYTCHSWAVGETGFDPTKAQSVEQAPVPKEQSRSGLRGALRGASVGAVVAEIGDNDTSNGAAKGAAIGALGARGKANAANAKASQQQQQAQKLSQQQMGEYNKARSVCLEAKGYSVSD